MQKGLDFIKENPWRFVKLLGRKLLLFFNGYEIPNNYYFYQTRDDSSILKISFFSFAIILPLAVLGIALSLKRWKDFYLIYSFVFIYLVSSLVFYVLSRLRAPVIPFLIIFAGFFIGEIFEKLKNSKIKQVLILIIIACAIFGLTQINLINKREFNMHGYVQKGNIYQSVRDFPLAADAYNKAIAIQSDNAIIRYSLLQTYISMNRPSQANSELQAIINSVAVHPDYQVYAHLAQARFSIAQRDFNRAAAEFEQAVILNPYDAEIHYLLGAVYITLGRNLQALKEIKRTLELDPNHPDAQRAMTVLQGLLPK
jgi:tetratricopeptide (TPR) repeat protein